MSLKIILHVAVFKFYLQFCFKFDTFIFWLLSSDTLHMFMYVCPTVSEIRFYGCCHPCFFFTKANSMIDHSNKKKLYKTSLGPSSHLKKRNFSFLFFTNDPYPFLPRWVSHIIVVTHTHSHTHTHTHTHTRTPMSKKIVKVPNPISPFLCTTN